MSDIELLMFGCGVTFLAAGGAYLVLRERFLSGFESSTRGPSRPAEPGEALGPAEEAA